ncbi:2,3-bisphosphoglycerate-independent phosphoglycerate mutase [Thalassorhabdomicrobium marinisediminis]|uniref:2,3-bisphosphoglycerate-independent phosphoglycerate mutase n=1 Tax=Thalassorhabdomicrobium marinisediminis TaxID=2170577 RepID=A0A2T7FVS7_9RHOB|nr:2,3-bisphosphoglycerate-independent phosphoglycerate mutase [Thalassorhabdomicrobium marinisediminis]PVA06258.1 2,3-bisphosphoglycerate-independent phosphoglycerate mutase [Thalassorhabdomicrobium marinisediminis]
MSTPKPVVLCILDGWGKRAETEGNAPALAHVPNFDRIMSGPTAQLVTHGPDVGLPEGQMGNSEVGHTNIGAGRVVAMTLGRIDGVVADKKLARQPVLDSFIATLKQTGGTAHLMGLVSEGGVHGMFSHTLAAVKEITAAGVPVALHAITDGRDVAPRDAQPYLRQLDAAMPEGSRIATLSGRYFAMDRDNRWDRVQKAYDAMARGEGVQHDGPAEAALEAAYARDESDEFVTPTVLGDFGGMADGDGFFCLNFRSDRAREITQALRDPAFDGFARGDAPHLAAAIGMVKYSDAHELWLETVFPKEDIPNTLGAWVSQHGLRQFRVAETEKYPHVTFFLNGGVETPEVGEDRYMAPSPKVATYDLQPEMSAAEVTEAFVGAIRDGYDLIVCNYANPDMVGHTGDLQAAIKACEAVDAGLGAVLEALEAAGGAMIVTADHGNCETMIDPDTGGPHTAHTTNPVPVALVGGPSGATLRDGRLADLAPTLLTLMRLELPPEMTGTSLLS